MKLKLFIAFFAFCLGVAAFFVWDGLRMLPDAVQIELTGSPIPVKLPSTFRHKKPT
jgi:hypothetical protein